MKVNYEIKCPKCKKKTENNLNIDKILYNARIEEVRFCCGYCEMNYFYQHGMIDCGQEMSTYKNDNTSEIHKIIHELEKELSDILN